METEIPAVAPRFPTPAQAGSRTASHLCDLADRRAEKNLEQWKSSRAIGGASLPDELVDTWVLADVATYHSIADETNTRLQNRIAGNSFAYPHYAEALGWIDPALATRIEPKVQFNMLAEFFTRNANLELAKIREHVEEAPRLLQSLLADSAKLNAMNDDLRRHLHWIPQVRMGEVHAAIATAERDANGDRSQFSQEHHTVPAAENRQNDASRIDDNRTEVHAVASFLAANNGLLKWKIHENFGKADEDLQALLASPSRMAAIRPDVDRMLEGINAGYVDEVLSAIKDHQSQKHRDSNAHAQKLNADAVLDSVSYPRDDEENTRETTSHVSEQYPSQTSSGLMPPSPPADGLEAIASAPPFAPSNDHPHLDGAASRIAADAEEMPAASTQPGTTSGNDEDATNGDLSRPQEIAPRDLSKASRNDDERQSGFAPGVPVVQPRMIVPIGDLLERMTYSSHKDGTVMYSIDGRPAFVDHGNQLLMFKEAEHDEQAILGAVLLAKEKYGGVFEITGDADFQRRTIEVMLKYAVDVRLKNPEQHALFRDLVNKAATTEYLAASPEHPVAPVNLSKLRPVSELPTSASVHSQTMAPNVVPTSGASSWTRADAAPDASAPSSPAVKVNRLAGKLLDHGEAPFQNIPDNKMSYFVTLENSDGVVKTVWGIDLPRALATANAATHDWISLQNLGQQPVEVKQPIRDERGQIVGYEKIMSHRNKWEVLASSSANNPPPSAGGSDDSGLPRTPHNTGKPAGESEGRDSSTSYLLSPNHIAEEAAADAQPAHDADPVNRLAGVVIKLGGAPFNHKEGNAPSYFIELENSDGRRHTAWGLDLARAIENAGVCRGDTVVLQNLGKKSIQIPVIGLDDAGIPARQGSRKTNRVVWEIENISRPSFRTKNPVSVAPPVAKSNDAPKPHVALRTSPSTSLSSADRDEVRRASQSARLATPAAVAGANRQRPAT